MKTKQSTFAGRVAKFCVGGGLGVACYYAALFILTELVGLWYVIASVIGFAANISVNFIMQKFWTFSDTSIDSIHKQAGTYVLTGIAFLIANTTLLYALVEFAAMPYWLAQIALTFILSLTSFFVTQRIFTRKPSALPIAEK